MTDIPAMAATTLKELAFAPKLLVQCRPKAAACIALPVNPNTVCGSGPWSLWLGPQEWLVYADSGAADSLSRTLELPASHLATDVSSGLTALELAGPGAGEVLTAGCGLDIAGTALCANSCAQTHYHHVSIILHHPEGDDRWRLFVDRSLTRYLRDSLSSQHEIRHL
jgi:sarcosine oxidase subunit gamma